MEEETLENKQLYLRTEIIMNGYDAHEFSMFLSDLRGEEKVDLEFWSMDDLKKAVESFKNSKEINIDQELKKIEDIKNLEKEYIENKKIKKFNKFFKGILKRRNSSVQQKRDNLNYKLEEKNDIKNPNIIKIRNISIDKNNNYEKEEIYDIINDNNENDKNIIKCQKLEKNELTDKNDLNIVVSTSTKIKKNILLNSIQFNIETNPIGFKTIRKYDDFDYLYEKLCLINSKVFNPIIPQDSSKKDINSKILFLNYYMNALIQNSYFRSLEIVYDFLTLTIDEWEQIKIQKYNTIKEPFPINKIANLEGYFNIEIKKGDEEKYLRIKEDINHKSDAYNKFNNAINDLLNIMEKMSLAIKNLSDSLGLLKNSHIDNKSSMNFFAHLEIFTREWGKGYNTQKNYINDNIKYFFRYMDRENNAFLKYYENFKKIIEEKKSKIEKIKKNNNSSIKDKKNLKLLEKETSFNIANIYGEYQKLNNNQAERLENLLIKFGTNKKEFFNDMNNFYELINVFNAKKEEEKNIKEALNKKEIQNSKKNEDKH